MNTKLIVGLGNPGKKYTYTRHNLGFLIVEAYAKKYYLDFRTERDRQGEVAKGVILEKNVTLLMPMTYMNESGRSVRMTVDYYKIPTDQVMIISDDVAIPFGSFRMREKGSAGGHYGLKSIEAHLGTQDYPRLRAGVGDRLHGDLSSHVLSKFTEAEIKDLPKIIDEGIDLLDRWVQTDKITLKKEKVQGDNKNEQ